MSDVPPEEITALFDELSNLIERSRKMGHASSSKANPQIRASGTFQLPKATM